MSKDAINSGAHWDNVTSEQRPIVPKDIVPLCPHLLLKK